MTGNPIFSAAALASVADATVASSSALAGNEPVAMSYLASTLAPFHAIQGTPADWAMIVLPILSPNACMGGPAGPMNLMGGVLLASEFGRDGFSLA